MRRMVKEDLLTFDGKPLFPERRAYTVPYELSDAEQDLYDAVTQYVREEMNRADRLEQEGDTAQLTVGFALTVLQRRLASSPEAILRSLERRARAAGTRRQQMIALPASPRWSRACGSGWRAARPGPARGPGRRSTTCRAARSRSWRTRSPTRRPRRRPSAELDDEIALLADLEELARRVRHSGTDRKWTELRDLLADNALITRRATAASARSSSSPSTATPSTTWPSGSARLLGRPEAVVSDPRRRAPRGAPQGHGGVRPGPRLPGPGRHRRGRRGPEPAARAPDGQLRPAVEPEPDRAAVRPHPPDRPDRGLPPVEPGRRRHPRGRRCSSGCSTSSRSSARPTSGKVFDVLGEAFEGQPLRELLLEAIRYGELPEVRARLDEVIDATRRRGPGQADRRAGRSATTCSPRADLEKWRARDGRGPGPAAAAALHPGVLPGRVHGCWAAGSPSARPAGTRSGTCPPTIRDRDRQIGLGAPVAAPLRAGDVRHGT